MFRKGKNKGQATFEYIALFLMIVAAIIIFQKYMSRGVTGRLKGVGDALGQGRIYDPHLTTACAFDIWFPNKNRWYEEELFDANCIDKCLEVTRDLSAGGDCDTCIGESDPDDICN